MLTLLYKNIKMAAIATIKITNEQNKLPVQNLRNTNKLTSAKIANSNEEKLASDDFEKMWNEGMTGEELEKRMHKFIDELPYFKK